MREYNQAIADVLAMFDRDNSRDREELNRLITIPPDKRTMWEKEKLEDLKRYMAQREMYKVFIGCMRKTDLPYVPLPDEPLNIKIERIE